MDEDEEIAERAYRLWEERGRPLGSPEVDWYRAVREVEARGSEMPSLFAMSLGEGW